MNKIIVIGGGIAGLSAAQAARETDPQARVHLVCGEKILPYYRPRICELFSGLEKDKLTVRNYQWFMDNSIEVINSRAASVDAEDKKVRFEDGSFLLYDKLILAAGATGNKPELAGGGEKNVLALRFLADIERVQKVSGPIVLVGGGLLGLEAAWHLSKTGRPVTIIERGEWLLKRQLDDEAARFFLGIVEKAGVRVALLGQAENYNGRTLLLADGRAFEASCLIFAAGIAPQTRLGKAMGLALGRGITVDEFMRTDRPDIYACGDCAEYLGQTPGLWTVSMAQGMIAGKNAAGAEAAYAQEAPPYMMKAMGSSIWSAGAQTANSLTEKSSVAGQFIKLFFDEQDKLNGAILIGGTAPALDLKKGIAAGMGKEEAEVKFIKRNV
ncbi:MAG: FAD-dependent oxidoreductase [Clostridiales bacterium]|nr:FAD-dependent oxidoreductase [Clostridiales bacterium]